jgi:hypothetical protein
MSLLLAPTDILGVKRVILAGSYTKPANSSAQELSSSNSLASQQTLTCDSSDCTWPDFYSVGMCSKVANVTSHLAVSQVADSEWGIPGTNLTYSASLPSVNLTLTAPNIHSFGMAVPSAPSISFNDSDTNLTALNAYFIFGNPSFSMEAAPTFEAVEILQYWCLKQYSVSISGGKTTTTGSDAASTIILDNATSLAAQFNSKFTACKGSGFDCPAQNWGKASLFVAGGNTSTDQTRFDIEELTGAFLSSLMVDSFGGIGTSIPRGGNFLQGLDRRVYQMDSDIAFAFGTDLFGDPSKPSNPAVQLDAVKQASSNMVTSLTSW